MNGMRPVGRRQQEKPFILLAAQRRAMLPTPHVAQYTLVLAPTLSFGYGCTVRTKAVRRMVHASRATVERTCAGATCATDEILRGA